MIIEDIDISSLPPDPESAFINYVYLLRRRLEIARQDDAKKHHGLDGEYLGNYAPDRFFVSSIMAFLDEYRIEEVELEDISELDNDALQARLPSFETRINYILSRYRIRINRSDTPLGTPAFIAADFKTQINSHLETIRKIVEQEITDPDKKDDILKKLSSLQNEINRDRTSFDRLMQRIVEFTNTLGVAAENIDPLIDKLERIKKLIFDGVRRGDALPKPERRKSLPSPEEESHHLDDDTPF